MICARITPALIALAWCLLSPLAHAKNTVTLEHLFRSQVQCQAGGTCTTFSISALLEAECFIRTGKRVDISEGLSLLMMISNFELNKCELDTSCFKDQNSLLTDELDSKSLDQYRLLINSGSICTESALPMKDVIRFARETRKIALQKTDAELRGWLKERITNFLSRKIKNAGLEVIRTKAGGIRSDGSNSSTLRKCIEQGIDFDLIEWSARTAKKWINRGKPLLCARPYYPLEKQHISHYTLIIGHRVKNGKTEFLYRDSNFSTPRWGVFGDCEHFYVIS